jgi:hypothetical protein
LPLKWVRTVFEQHGLAHLRGKIIVQGVRAVRESVRNPG